MKEVSIVGLDLAKRVFQVHAAGSDGSVVLLLLVGQEPCSCGVASQTGRDGGKQRRRANKACSA